MDRANGIERPMNSENGRLKVLKPVAYARLPKYLDSMIGKQPRQIKRADDSDQSPLVHDRRSMDVVFQELLGHDFDRIVSAEHDQMSTH